MKIVCNELFALVLLSIIQGSLEYIQSANESGENRFHKKKKKNICNFYGTDYLVYYKCFQC